MMNGPRDDFMAATFWHGSRARADAILSGHPELRSADIHIAAILGDDAAVRRFIAADPSSVHAKSGPHDVPPIVSLCFSVYTADRTRSDAFVRAATALLDAGADVNSGFYDTSTNPPSWESLLYGAAGVHFNPALTRLLLERGIDPNDGETPYHSVEGPDNDAFRVLLESDRLDADSLATMLLRKADWHDIEGLRLLLDRGVDPNHFGPWHGTALHQALRRDNGIENIDLLLDRGADPTLRMRARSADDKPPTAVEIAAGRGRADVLRSLMRRGVPIDLSGVEALLAACALDDGPRIAAIVAAHPESRQALLADGATFVAEFAGTANANGVARLLDLGVPVDARYSGDGYFGTPKDSTALHVAAWRAWQPVIDLLIARGADVNAKDGDGRTPLQLAVRAATVSFWTRRRTPDAVRSLLAAGASKEGIVTPTGYDAIDTLLTS